MGRALTASQRETKKRALLEFLDAAARNGQVCPSLDQLGKLTRTSGSTIAVMIEELRKAGLIQFWFKTAAMLGQYRVVKIVATGLKTAAPARRRSAPSGARYKLDRLDQDARVDGEARDRVLYGGILEDVQFLRHRGWIITSEKGRYRVGNQLVDAPAIVAKAQRERRLAGVPE